MKLDRILLAGCGNMAGAMLTGWLAGGLEAIRFGVYDPARPLLPAGVREHKAVPHPDDYDAVLLGFKPQVLASAAPDLAQLGGRDKYVLSLLAGADLATLRGYFPEADAIVRVMPNLAAALRASPVVLAGEGRAGEVLSDDARRDIEHLMRTLGTAEWVEEELLDAATALVGSGPAFVYRFIDALARAGAGIGFAPDQAERLAVQMVEGAAALAALSDNAPGELAQRVASPGGTTEAGLSILDQEEALARLVAQCLAAARDRGAELAREAAQPR